MTIPFVPPHDQRAEVALLGAVLLSSEARDALAETGVDTDDFYVPANQTVFAAVAALANRGDAVDAVTVASHLENKGLLESIGGPGRLVELQSQTPSTSNVANYAAAVKRTARLRRLAATARAITERAMDPGDADAETVIQEAEQAIYDVSAARHVTKTNPIGSYTTDALADIDLRASDPGVIRGVATGFTDYDQLLSGYQPGTFNVVAARPSMGKSSFAAAVSIHAALENAKTVALFTLEMSAVETVKRFLSINGRINANNLRTGHLRPGERDQIDAAAATLENTSLYLNESSDLTVPALRSECRRVAAKARALDLVVIDYLQLMDSVETTSSSTREREVAAQSRGLKMLARELNVPVVCLAQVNRGVEQRTDKRPTLADLRESGAIEADADTVTFLYRDEVYQHDSPDRGLAELIVAKHRAGPTGTVKVAFLPQYTSFENLAQRPQS